MNLEKRIEEIEKKLIEIEARHQLEDEELRRIRAAMSHAAKFGIEELLSEQAK